MYPVSQLPYGCDYQNAQRSYRRNQRIHTIARVICIASLVVCVTGVATPPLAALALITGGAGLMITGIALSIFACCAKQMTCTAPRQSYHYQPYPRRCYYA